MKPHLTKAERLVKARFLRIIRGALIKEKIKGVRYAVDVKHGQVVMRLGGGDVDKFLAFEAIHKHSSSSSRQSFSKN